MVKQFYVYIITNKQNTVLYTGITNNLERRVYEHKNKTNEGFTKKYNVSKLVYYETFGNSNAAIAREKQIKAGSRDKKVELVNRKNPEWKNIASEWPLFKA
ncbi:Excinuclease ABC, C subunit-like [hydrothermal vent metagenome]|uniref:Excinuclease ABC, C subunit-like n=1 Tax=hydrothermal vent metagenome TaxID=652676 RepID=A0A3B1CHL0_9ZZZZ